MTDTNKTLVEDKSPIEQAIAFFNEHFSGLDPKRNVAVETAVLLKEYLELLLPADLARSQRIKELERDLYFEKGQNESLLAHIRCLKYHEGQLESALDRMVEENKHLHPLIAGKDNEIERLKGLMESAHMAAWIDFPEEGDPRTKDNTIETSWTKFKEANNL